MNKQIATNECRTVRLLIRSDKTTYDWNPEGTLARWTDPHADYERVFSYDEEGRLTRIERDDGQSVQTAYEYVYTGDGIWHMKKDHLAEKEYRYGCSIDCSGTPLRVYERTLGSHGECSVRATRGLKRGGHS